jgi:deazaflavin-dependent oxidoreductase (nitroreductase family)
MKIPEPFFVLINPMMRILLRSPMHSPISESLMLITFTGRKSGRQFTTPVRYVEKGETICCFTSSDTQWWRNLRGGAEVTLRISGKDARCHAEVIENNPQEAKRRLREYLTQYPQDADYHDIRLNKDKSLVEADLNAAADHAIVVLARRLQ